MTASIRLGWRKINRLESKIEATSRATESGGYFRNIYGGYDRTDLTEDLLGEFQRLVRVAPDAAYRHGAALLRAGRLQEARSAYNQLIPGSSEARLKGKNEDIHNSLELTHLSTRFAPKNGLSATKPLAFSEKRQRAQTPAASKML